MTNGSPFSHSCEVVVVGAGAAGLAAARRLREHGVDVLLLEAHGRVGGRAYTLRTSDGAYPIELGPEFIHGTAESTMALLRECGEETVEMPDSDASGVWEATERVLSQVDVDGPDASVDAFLKTVDAKDAAQARLLIEGFDAALIADTSIIAIANEWRSNVNDTHMRPAQGYGILMQCLENAVKDSLWLKAPVSAIHWSKDGVEVHATRAGSPVIVSARCAILTLPIGVLHEGSVQFTPALPPQKRAAIDAIGMGPVVKVMLEFRSVFWDGEFWVPGNRDLFPTVWSRLPQRAPVLAAWAGGDTAKGLAAQSVDPIEAAIETCVQLFPHVDVRAQLLRTHCHDWQRDPYARGAYSYLRVNAGDARKRLGEPIDGVLFFAGEATTPEDAGTVAGAFDSGYRAAAQVLAPLRR